MLDCHLGGVLSGGAPTGPVTPPDHAPSGGVTEGIQVSGRACWERAAPVGISQLQSATWQRATAGTEGKRRYDDKVIIPAGRIRLWRRLQ